MMVTVEKSFYKGKNALVLQIKGEANGDNTLAILKGIEFHNGVIEATICGQPLANAAETARGFVGIAFRPALSILFKISIPVVDSNKRRKLITSVFLVSLWSFSVSRI